MLVATLATAPTAAAADESDVTGDAGDGKQYHGRKVKIAKEGDCYLVVRHSPSPAGRHRVGLVQAGFDARQVQVQRHQIDVLAHQHAARW